MSERGARVDHAGTAGAAGVSGPRSAPDVAGLILLAAVAAALLASAGLITLAVGSPGALGTVADARVTLASPDRSAATRAAFDIVAAHPVTGVGAGAVELRSTTPDGGTRHFAHSHDEYLQLAAELGLVGLVLLAVLLAGLARLLWTARTAGVDPATWAAAVAGTAGFAVHSALDFVWHLPAVLLAVLLVAGAGLPAPARHTEPRPSLDEEVSR